jgi:diguanylate cyclase (GGDEF)-like protein
MDENAPRAKRRRPPRFVLPDHADERTNESIEEFIAGTPRRRAHRRIPVSPAPTQQPPRPARSDPWSGLDSRVDWEDALRREEARVARYGRPATVVVLDVALAVRPQGSAGSAVRSRIARSVASVLLEEARDSDRLARVGESRFHVLLPETTEREAGRYLDRVHATLRRTLDSLEAVADLRAGVAGARSGDGLAGAVSRAAAAMAARRSEAARTAEPARPGTHVDRSVRPA